METMKRTVNCGELTRADSGRKVILNGWVHRKRDHGGISFINLRDRYGITQVVVDPEVFGGEVPAEMTQVTSGLRNEFCLAVEGVVRARPDSMINPDMPTGEIEVVLEKIIVLSRSEILPFQIDDMLRLVPKNVLLYKDCEVRAYFLCANQ